MSNPRIPSQWQLQDTGEAGDQWMLRDNEQRLPSHLQLQPDADYTPPDVGWQPLDYRAVQMAAAPRRRGGWILATLLTLAVLGVLGYVAARTFGIPEPLASLLPSSFNLAQAPAAEGTPAAAETTPEAETSGAEPAVAPLLAITDTEELSGTLVLSASETLTETTVDARAGVTGAAGAAAASEEATPTATATPTPAPTPEPVVVRTATVSSGAGVNLRRNPQNDAELIRTLPDETSYVVASGPITGTDGTAWVQLALTDTLGYVSASFATIVTQTVPFSDAVTLLTGVGLAPPTPPQLPVEASNVLTETAVLEGSAASTETVAGATAGEGESDSAATSEAESEPAAAEAPASAMPTATPRGIASRPRTTGTPTAARTPVRTPTPLPTATAPLTLTAVISTANGLNLRTEPQTGNNLIDMLANSTVVTITARVPGDQWVYVSTANGEEGYLAADFLVIEGNLEDMMLEEEEEASGLQLPTPTPQPGAAAGPTPAPTSAFDDLDSGLISGGPGTLTVSNVSGVNVRREPAGSDFLATLSWNATALALGRTSDSQWVFVQLNDGTTGWVAAQAVEVVNGLASLTVLQ